MWVFVSRSGGFCLYNLLASTLEIMFNLFPGHTVCFCNFRTTIKIYYLYILYIGFYFVFVFCGKIIIYLYPPDWRWKTGKIVFYCRQTLNISLIWFIRLCSWKIGIRLKISFKLQSFVFFFTFWEKLLKSLKHLIII